MPRAAPLQPSFNAGEFSPRMEARTDFAKYPLGCATLENMLPLPQGGIARRPGTLFVAEVKEPSKRTRLIPFEFSTEQAYVIEAGDLYFRFYKDSGQIESSPGVAYEISSPYSEGQLAQLKWAQSADVLFIVHPGHRPRKLSRTGHTSWSLTEIEFKDGPYLAESTTGTTLQPSAVGGNGITITASGGTGINDDQGFLSTDIGRLIRIKHSNTWGYAKITAVNSVTQVVADVVRDFGGTTASAAWRLGAWSASSGFPAAIAFFEQRLCFAGTRHQPQTFWMSQSADFENMEPDSLPDGGGERLVADDDALDYTISADQVNVIRWMSPGKNLFIGTVGGEWVVKSEGALITPSDVDVKRQTSFGSADVAPQTMRGRLLFLQRAARKIMEFTFSFEIDNFQALDQTLLADHVTRGGLTEMAYQQELDSALWCVRNDGQLPTLTYQPDQNVIGWARQILGGSFQGSHAVAESVAVIPGPGQDEVWLIVKRTIEGVTRRYIEYLAPSYETGAAQAAADYADCAVRGHFPDGATEIAGLDHLEGETVSVYADGAVHPTAVVTGGMISLDGPTVDVAVGLPYTHTYRSLKWEAGSAIGTAQGQIKRIEGVTLVLLDSLNAKIGPTTTALRTVPFRDVGDPMDSAVPLFTGERYIEFNGDYGADSRVVIQGAEPVPFTLLALSPNMKTNTR